MGDVHDHYSNLLAKHYTWMFGAPFAAKVVEQKTILEDALKPPAGSGLGLAVDLASGPGFQTIALAEMGYEPVIAIDMSEHLLQEMRSYRGIGPYRRSVTTSRS